jgi:NADH:ubiquinone oxidoreductase subunit F (NADH-binding)
VPHILLAGADWYANLGTPKNGGTRLFCLSGNLERPGVYELAMGYNLKKMVYEVGGGIPNGRKLKAVVPGGSSTPVLLPDEIDVPMDFDALMKAGSMLGSGGVVVLDDTTCMVKFALRTIKFYQHESCGWCIPCREGTDWLKKTLTRFHAGGGIKKDIDNIQYLSENMLGRTFCPLGDAAAMPTIAFVRSFARNLKIIWKEGRVPSKSRAQSNNFQSWHKQRIGNERDRTTPDDSSGAKARIAVAAFPQAAIAFSRCCKTCPMSLAVCVPRRIRGVCWSVPNT